MQFCLMIARSKDWNIINLEEKLNKWSSRFNNKTRERNTVIELVQEAFNKCSTKEDINKLRGTMAEAMVVAALGGYTAFKDNNYGWGAEVQIIVNLKGDYEEIHYRCEHKDITVGCGSHNTVDVGKWNGMHGEFYESKVSPVGIGCKEIGYMKKLKSQLQKNNISHELYFVCMESVDEIKLKITDFSEELSTKIKPCGYNELRKKIS